MFLIIYNQNNTSNNTIRFIFVMYGNNFINIHYVINMYLYLTKSVYNYLMSLTLKVIKHNLFNLN